MNAFTLLSALHELKELNTTQRVATKIADREWELKQSECKMFPCMYPNNSCMAMCFNEFGSEACKEFEQLKGGSK